MNEQSSLLRFLKDDLLRWKIFAVHFVLFCVAMAFLGLTITSSEAAPIPVTSQLAASPSSPPIIFPLFSVVWVAMLALHFIITISNESNREKAKQLAEKPKRHHLEIGDDGELVEIVDTDEVKEKTNAAK